MYRNPDRANVSVKNCIRELAAFGYARKKEIGAYRDHILHEICHAFLYMLGYTPLLERSFGNNELSNYESAEWQAKALCGEIMIPYDESKDMSVDEIMDNYKVSRGQAYYRFNKIK